jgi:hypothetical protein
MENIGKFAFVAASACALTDLVYLRIRSLSLETAIHIFGRRRERLITRHTALQDTSSGEYQASEHREERLHAISAYEGDITALRNFRRSWNLLYKAMNIREMEKISKKY